MKYPVHHPSCVCPDCLQRLREELDKAGRSSRSEGNGTPPGDDKGPLPDSPDASSGQKGDV